MSPKHNTHTVGQSVLFVVVCAMLSAGITARCAGETPHAGKLPTMAAWETLPSLLTYPAESVGELFAHLLQAEHDRVQTNLDATPIGIQPAPDRPALLLEWNERFLAPGFLSPGIELPTGAVWRPSLWVFGQMRSALNYLEDPAGGDQVSEWANRLDLNAQVNLTGTERLVVAIRPLDEQLGDRRLFSGYDFRRDRWSDGWNGDVQTLFFEGDMGELFPRLAPQDFRAWDWFFAVGRMPLLAQQGLLINEDMMDAVTLTRDTISGHGLLDLRVTGFYAWRGVNRSSPITAGNQPDRRARMVGLLSEADLWAATIAADIVHVDSGPTFGSVWAGAMSAIFRHEGYRNTYNLAARALLSHADGMRTAWSDDGVLLFHELSWTPHGSHDLIYVNGFWAIDQYTSPARGPLQGGPLGQTGILFASPAIGQFGAPIDVRTDDIAGASLGYQFLFADGRQQVVMEIGGAQPTKGRSDGRLGGALRVQRAIGQHHVLLGDCVLLKSESDDLVIGLRGEWLMKF